MTGISERRVLLQRLQAGLPPPPAYASRTLVGLDRLLGEWTRDLDEYVASGGSLVRIVVAPPGSGKTHLGDALKAAAAERGFLVCAIDVQAHRTGGDDLAVYQTFCRGLTLAESYLGGDGEGVGLRAMIRDVSGRMSAANVRDALAQARLPVPVVRDILSELVCAVLGGASLAEPGWSELVTCLSGERPRAGSLPTLRRLYPDQFRTIRRMPTRRDAHLWMESILLAIRALGFPGAIIVLDEHDDTDRRGIDASISQLRTKLDRLAQGGLPGTFVVYLVLADFPERVQRAHTALDQRVRKLFTSECTRMMILLQDSRDIDGPELLVALADRLHQEAYGCGIPSRGREPVTALARRHVSLGGPRIREFVKSFVQYLEDG